MPVASTGRSRRSSVIGIRTSFSVPEPSGEATVAADDWEKRSVDESDKCGWDRSDDSKRREIGSSDVRVKERKRVEKFGTPAGAPWGGGVPGQVARRICMRSSRSRASRAGLVSLRAAQDTRRMLLSTVGTMPARLSLEKVCVCSSSMLDAGGALGGADRSPGESKGLPVEDWRVCRGVMGEEGESSET